MGVTSVTIGLATLADTPAMAALSRDLIEAGLGWNYREARIAAFVAHAEYVALVARAPERDGEMSSDSPAGFAVMQFREERAHLVLLAVRALWQRQGVGRRLLQWLLDSARVAGVASVHVELREGNEAAYALYRDAGFAPTLRMEGYYQGRENALRMMLMLRDPAAVLPDWRPPATFRRQ